MAALAPRYEPSVLVIDDEAVVCDAVVRILRRAGFRAIGVDGGIKGVEVAEEIGPDVILLDLQMRGIDGRVTLKLLRAQARPSVILAFTGLLIHDEPLLYEGFDGVIRKPVFAFELVERITGAMASTASSMWQGSPTSQLLAAARQRLRTA